MDNPASFRFDQGKSRRTMAMLAALASQVPQEAIREVDRMVLRWQSEVKRHMPVDKGLAKNSVAVVTATMMGGGAIQGKVGTNVPYVPYLEFGTRFIAGGQVLTWKPGMTPVLTWPAKEEGLGQQKVWKDSATGKFVRAGTAGSAPITAADSPEFMPPFRGSWQLIAGVLLDHARKTLAAVIRKAASVRIWRRPSDQVERSG